MVTSLLVQRFPALQSSDFRRWFVSGFFVAGARWATVLGRGWLIFEITGSASAVGVVIFASFFPFVVVGPVAGAVADRMDRRLLLIGATAVAALASLVLMVITLAGWVEVWHVVALSLLSGSAQAVSAAARQALMANLVEHKHLLNAIALGSIAQYGSRIIGPLFGAVLLSAVGAGYVFMLSTILLALGLVETWRIRHRSTATRTLGRSGAAAAVRAIGGDLREGFAYVERDRRVATVMVLVMLHCGLTMAFESMMPTLSTTVGGASTTYSAILVGIGVGAIAGTVTLSLVRTPVALGRALTLAGFGSGLSMLVIGLASSPAVVVAGAALAGATQASFMTLAALLIQQVVPDALRGRVMSLYLMLAAGIMAFLNFGFGWAADGVGVRLLLVTPALLWTAVFLTAAVGLGEVRHLLRRGTFSAAHPVAEIAVDGE